MVAQDFVIDFEHCVLSLSLSLFSRARRVVLSRDPFFWARALFSRLRFKPAYLFI